MIKQPEFNLEPWSLRESELILDRLPQTESVFALSNGHIGWRGNLDEGEPHGMPGSYLNGVYEVRPLPFAEQVYGRPTTGQTVINVVNGKVMRLFVDDEPFDVRYGRLLSHERVLDFRSGLLTRRAEWTSPAGGSVRVTSTRLVSFTNRAVGAISYEVEPIDQRLQISVQSSLLANEQLPDSDGDPRAAAVLEHPLNHEFDAARDLAVILVHRTGTSGLRIGTAMDHHIDAPGEVQTEARSYEDGGLVTASTVLQAWSEAAHHQVRGLRLVEREVAAGGARPGIRGAERREARGLGWPRHRATGLSRRLLGPRRCRGRG